MEPNIGREKTIILASSSPRRKQLLELIGLKFQVEPSYIKEIVPDNLKPHDQVITLSRLKAIAVANKHRESIVIAADTIGILDGQILNKPEDDSQAINMLRSMSGKCHSVITGFTIIDSDNKHLISRSIETKVYFRDLTYSEIKSYVKTGEPLDKAGAYAIQGLASIFVEKIQGDYFNVIGLPLCALSLALKEFGVAILNEDNI
jgi:septum formation protein